jgi:hypothetical protein
MVTKKIINKKNNRRFEFFISSREIRGRGGEKKDGEK